MQKNNHILDSLQKLKLQRESLVESLIRTEALTVATMHESRRRCGKPGCYCVEKPGHLQTILMSVSEGRRRCQVVRKADVDTVRQSVAKYRDFKTGLSTLKAIDTKVLALLKQLMRQRDKPYE